MNARTQLFTAVILAILTGLLIGLLLATKAHASNHFAVGDIKDGFTIAAVVISQIFGAGAVWGAVRSDIKYLHEKTAAAERRADEAHARIDDLYERGIDRRR